MTELELEEPPEPICFEVLQIFHSFVDPITGESLGVEVAGYHSYATPDGVELHGADPAELRVTAVQAVADHLTTPGPPDGVGPPLDELVASVALPQ